MSLFIAIKNKDINALKALLFQGKDGDHHDPLSPISSTSFSGHVHSQSSKASSSYPGRSFQMSPPNQPAGFHQNRRKQTVDPNEKNVSGFTPLHLAVASGNEELVSTLCKSPRVNVNLQDAESGYTALHKVCADGSYKTSLGGGASWALFDGNLQIALTILRLRNDCDLSIRDREGNTCLDLLNTTLEHPSHVPKSRENVDSDSDEEGESHVTDTRQLDPATSLWTWGSNSNFNLGHQNSDDRAFPERVDIAPAIKRFSQNEKVTMSTLQLHQPLIQSVKMSKYHSSIVACNDFLYMNGFGPGGRLGLGNEDTTLKPRIVAGIHGSIKQVSLGPDHSVAITTDGTRAVYLLPGYASEAPANGAEAFETEPNEVVGVLKKVIVVGCAASKHHTAVFSDQGVLYTWGLNLGQLGYQQPLDTVQVHPKKVTSFVSQKIVQIAATKNATCVLVENHEVFVYCLFQTHRVVFPQQEVPKNISFHAIEPSHVTKIVSGNHQFAALTSAGDVFLWSPPEKSGSEYADSWQQQNFPQKRPKKVWSVRKKHLAARDVAIGIDSCILICTSSGHVYLGHRRKEAKVSSATKVKQGTIDGKDYIYFKYAKVPYLQHIVAVAASSSGGFAAIRHDPRPEWTNARGPTLSLDLKQTFEDAQNLGVEGKMADVVFACSKNDIVYAHKSILACRSSFFQKAFESLSKEKTFSAKGVTIHNKGSQIEVSLPKVDKDVVFEILEFLYTGKTQDPSDISHFYHGQHANLIKIFDLGDVLARRRSSELFLRSCLDKLYMDSPSFSVYTDVILRLQEQDVEAHGVVLMTRCEFFRAMLGQDSQWMVTTEDGKVVVQLTHWSWDPFRIVLRWLYSDGSLEVIDDVQKDNLNEYVDFVVDVLAIANELLLEGLKDICSSILCSILEISNVISLLEVADMYEAANLKEACLRFACWNLEHLLECHVLDEIHDDIMDDIEATLVSMQETKFPFTRGESGYYREVRRHAIELEEERKRQRKVRYEEQQQQRSLQKVSSVESISSANGEKSDGSESACEEQSTVTRPRKRDASSSSKVTDDNIFELEMEEEHARSSSADVSSSKSRTDTADVSAQQRPSSSSKRAPTPKKTWTKLPLAPPSPTQRLKSPQVTAEPETPPSSALPKSWTSPSVERKGKQSLRDIMEQEQKKGARPSPANTKVADKSPAPAKNPMTLRKPSPYPQTSFPSSSPSPKSPTEGFFQIKLNVQQKTSQRERRKSQTKPGAGSDGQPSSSSTPQQTPPSSSCPWGNVATKTATPNAGISLRDALTHGSWDGSGGGPSTKRPEEEFFQRQKLRSVPAQASELSRSLATPK
ncbi:hypothetical protein HK102_013898, partial [Quaeritorhiza haematococci]